MTFDDVIKLLKARYAPPAWAFLQQVGDSTGAYTSRHADAVAMGLWPSRGLELIGFEVKVSRNDWRRELKKPDKAEPIASRMDRFFVVAPADVVPHVEVPTNWGLLEVKPSGKIIQTKEAAKLEPLPLDRRFLAALLRRVSLEDPTREAELRLRREIRDDITKNELPRLVDIEIGPLRGELERLRTRVAAFEEATGVPLEDHNGQGYGFPDGAALGRAVLYLAGGGPRRLQYQLDSIDHMAETLKKISAQGREVLDDNHDAAGIEFGP